MYYYVPTTLIQISQKEIFREVDTFFLFFLEMGADPI